MLEALSQSDLQNRAYVNAQLAVASLTVAWHYVLRVEGHDGTAKLIEVALDGAYKLRERVKGKPSK